MYKLFNQGKNYFLVNLQYYPFKITNSSSLNKRTFSEMLWLNISERKLKIIFRERCEIESSRF